MTTRKAERERREISVRGIVQGVGFRPFIYALARRCDLCGWVRNDAEGVRIEAEGLPADLDLFLRSIKTEAPPLAMVEDVSTRRLSLHGGSGFRIKESRPGERRSALISPDVAVCENCLHELFDPADRRYRYPFINCTNCGPRFTITRSVPYDRPMTTMAGFPMCPECRREYDDPADRRFHAQPNACPLCGPRASLRDPAGREMPCGDAIAEAARLVRNGAIVAVKGLGGYHLACDPFDAGAVTALRERKARIDKPFAVMVLTLEEAQRLCHIGPEERALLTSPARPIVLLERREDSGIVEAVAPRQWTLGLMLAYTPLHHLLLSDAGMPLVMTSGNRSDEPIAYVDEEAFAQLNGIADCFLTHNRPIHMRCDDSVVRVSSSSKPSVILYPNTQTPEHQTPNTEHRSSVVLRRSRGYAPAPLSVSAPFRRQILACGGELKSTFCLAKDSHVFLSHHIGDLENYETLRSFREGIAHFKRLFDVRPEIVACDLHPEYLSTKYARELEEAGLPVVAVQHHHAHIAACLADNERPDDEWVIGAALDGTGYGTDGAIWGGEFLVGSIRDGFKRAAHLETIPLPGGEAAIRQPWRIAVAQLIRLYGEEEMLRLPLPAVQWAGEAGARNIARMLEHNLNTPLTSSAGRLFDAVAALVGVDGSRQITYEGQAAIELELTASADRSHAKGYPFRVRRNGEDWIVDTSVVLTRVVDDVLSGAPPREIASRFHRTMAAMVVAGCVQARDWMPVAGGEKCAVALSGGTFQNQILLELTCKLLSAEGFAVYTHQRVPTNDGGICLGQAVLANRRY